MKKKQKAPIASVIGILEKPIRTALLRVIAKENDTLDLSSIKDYNILLTIAHEFADVDIVYRECGKRLILLNTPSKHLFPLIKKNVSSAGDLVSYVFGNCFHAKDLLRLVVYTSGNTREQCIERLETFSNNLNAQISVLSAHINDNPKSRWKVIRTNKLIHRVLELMKKTKRFKLIHQLNFGLTPYLDPEQIIEIVQGMIDNCKTLDDHIYIKKEEKKCQITNYFGDDHLKAKISKYDKDHENDENFPYFSSIIFDLYQENEKRAMELINTPQDLLKADSVFRPTLYGEEEWAKFREDPYYQNINQILRDKFFNAEDLRNIFRQLGNKNPLKEIVAELLLKV